MYPLQNKHAVWCQCAAVISITLALSSLFSIQTITWNQDIYWSVVLSINAFLIVTVAEHGFRPVLMTKIASAWSGIVYMLIVTANSSLFSYVGSMIGLFVGAFFPQASYLLLLLGLLSYPSRLTLLLLVKLAAEYKYHDILNRAVGKRYIHVNKAVAAKVVGIVSETLLLWHLRCHSRFPHVYRWTPVLCSLCTCCCGLYWCHYYVAPTVVSHKSIIKSRGHGLTPSLRAAQECKICASCLTHLDIEDVFD